MSWYIYTLVQTDANAAKPPHYVKNLELEFARLNNQRCWACSGYGHAPKDCPTAVKIATLRVGVREQTKLIDQLKRAVKKDLPVVAVSKLSLLKAKTAFVRKREAKAEKKSKGDDAMAQKGSSDGLSD